VQVLRRDAWKPLSRLQFVSNFNWLISNYYRMWPYISYALIYALHSHCTHA